LFRNIKLVDRIATRETEIIGKYQRANINLQHMKLQLT